MAETITITQTVEDISITSDGDTIVVSDAGLSAAVGGEAFADNCVIKSNGASGTSAQGSGVLIDPSDNITGVTSLATPLVKASTSAGIVIANLSGGACLTIGAGGGGNATFGDGVNVNSGTLQAATVDINGGAIDATTVGATTPSSGVFTALTFNASLTGATNANLTMGTGSTLAAQAVTATTGAFASTVGINGGSSAIGAICVATATTTIAGPSVWSSEHAVIGGPANTSTSTALGVGVDRSLEDILLFAITPGVAWRKLRAQAAEHHWHIGGASSPSASLTSTGLALATGVNLTMGTGSTIQAQAVTVAGDLVGQGIFRTVGGNFEIYKDSTPTKATAVGHEIPGGAMTDYCGMYHYTGAAWVESFRFDSSSVTLATGVNLTMGTGSTLAAKAVTATTVNVSDATGYGIKLENNNLWENQQNGNSAVQVNYAGYNNGTTQFRDLDIYDGKNSLIARFDGSARQLQLSGDIYTTGDIYSDGTLVAFGGSTTGSAVICGGASNASSAGARVSAYAYNAPTIGGNLYLDADSNAASVDGAVIIRAGTALLTRARFDRTGIGFFGASPVAKPTVTGSRGGNAALASLLTSLASLGLITDSTSA